MSELAFNANGESFEVPAAVTAWRVRRMKPRGAPELVYGRDGRPLTVGADADIDDLREAVGTAGKYRLDPINDDGKCVENIPPAYVQVLAPERVGSAAVVPYTSGAHSDTDTVREAMRLNTELAKSVIDHFAEMVAASADLIRAADGAGIPARTPRIVDAADKDDDAEDDAEDDDRDTDGAPTIDLNAIVMQLAPVLFAAFTSGKFKFPGLAALFDWRKATPPENAKTEPVMSAKLASETTTTQDSASESSLPPLDPTAMAHVLAIQSALESSEVTYVQEVAKDMSAAELRGWFAELSLLSVPDAVVRIRSLIAGENGGAS